MSSSTKRFGSFRDQVKSKTPKDSTDDKTKKEDDSYNNNGPVKPDVRDGQITK